jgi:hypothetical protein
LLYVLRKTREEEAETYAGVAGAAHALYAFAQTTSAVNGTNREAAQGVTDLALQVPHARK